MWKRLKYFVFVVLYLTSIDAFSLSCRDITDEFYFSCDNSKCELEFMVGYKRQGGACYRRPMVFDLDQRMKSYLEDELSGLAGTRDGIYKLSVQVEFWRYQPLANVETFQNVLDKNYESFYWDTETDKSPIDRSVKELLEQGQHKVTFDFVRSEVKKTIEQLRQEKQADQERGFTRFILQQSKVWGLFFACFLFLIYSTNRFYQRLHVDSKIDIRSVLIQLLLFGAVCYDVENNSYDPWMGILLFPSLIVITIAELWAVLRNRFLKSIG